MSKILVTGGSGFIGANIVESLFKSGHQVRVYDNFSRGNKARLGHIINEIEIIEGDIRDVDLFTKSSKHIDTLIHLAYVNGTETFYKNPTLVLDVAIEGLISIREAIKKNKELSEEKLTSKERKEAVRRNNENRMKKFKEVLSEEQFNKIKEDLKDKKKKHDKEDK